MRLEHMEELRDRIIKSVIAIGIAFIGGIFLAGPDQQRKVAAGLGRTTLCRGQELAWASSLPAAGTGKGQRRGTPDRSRANPQAPIQLVGLGPASVP